MRNKQKTAIIFAILAAALYAVSSPLSKLLLERIPATMMAAFLYLGAGIGLALVGLVQKRMVTESKELPLTRKEIPYTVAMVVLDIIAPILLMIGLTMTTAANAALLNNFEIVATSIIALCIYKEKISMRLWLAIALVTISSMMLSVKDIGSISFSLGSIFVVLACICWGFENNCTRNLSSKNPLHIVVIKGLFSGTGSLIIALVIGERVNVNNYFYIILSLLLGFVAYGLSIYFYIYAQRMLGAAKTSTYYAVTPFIGTVLSLIIFREMPTISFVIALVIMMIGTYFASKEN